MADEINQVLGALDAQSKPPVKKTCKDTQTGFQRLSGAEAPL
jgi:hypothetical protein